MHGRLKVKTSKEQEEEQRIKRREQAYYFRNLSEKIFQLRDTIDTDDKHDEILKISSEILLINADFYTVWNIRREILTIRAARIEDGDLGIWRNELSFTVECLRKNEKSYSVWQHRVWVHSHMPKSEYESEILLCNSFLAKDERNFHCWDYRSYICELADRDIEKELEFTTEKIRSNFSNFSAWHRRHKLLIKGQSMGDDCPRSCDLKIIWDNEYDLTLNAVFTDPSDQSPWLYHNWLLRNNFNKFTTEHLDKLKELEELEPDNKWLKQAIGLARELIRN